MGRHGGSELFRMRVDEVTRKRFFFEKKKQKTSIRWSPVDRPWHKPNG
jgi:hypothetical protein